MAIQKRCHIKKDDFVVVIAGKSKGKTGQVLKLYPKTHQALVTKVNMIKKHQKPKSQTDLGGIIEKEGKIHISNLMVVDPKTKKATRVRMKVLENGKKVRVAVRSGDVLDKKA